MSRWTPTSRVARSLGVTMAVTALCATAALAAGCGLGGDDAGGQAGESTPVVLAPPPEEALLLYVQRRLLQGFVPDCDEAERPDDIAKQCARFVGERDGMRAYQLGPTFAPHTRLIILAQVDDAWTVVHLERRDPAQPPASGIPWPLRIGATVVVTITDDCLRVREEPGLDGREIDCLENGSVVTISGGPVEAGDLEWWQLAGFEGWSASNWLRYPEEAAATDPTATPQP